ncbi:MAG: NtaA/DmoA family FMN-dependent monooxygenase [Microbacterium sp.]|nr:NtaA/DmoA family FMN-dependent monooxygenase [Microbacterium sp.]
MHLAFDMSFTHTDGRWRLPGGWAGRTFPDLKMYAEMALIAERARLDMLFFGDGTGIPDTWQGSPDGAVRWGVGWPRQDMSPYIAALAQLTTGLGFGLTYSSTFMHPFYVARLLTSLNHISDGRIAFNVVASSRRADAANYGYDELMAHDQRYTRMNEFMDVCLGLWRSVTPEAIVMDPETGQFADPKQVHQLHHHGEHFDVRGPLSAAPADVVRPVLVQAGASPEGIAASAHFADLVFAQGGSIAAHVQHRAALDAELTRQGRRPDEVGVMWSKDVIVAETEEVAQHRRSQLLDIWTPEMVAVQLSNGAGFDLATLPDRFPLGEIGERIAKATGSKSGHFNRLIAEYGVDHVMTKDELFEEGRDRISGYSGVMAGTPEAIADHLEEAFEATGSNGGFMLSSHGAMPRALADIADLLVPELQRRGLFRREYEGSTLAENLLGKHMRDIENTTLVGREVGV